MEYYCAPKRSELLSRAKTRSHTKRLLVSESGQRETAAYSGCRTGRSAEDKTMETVKTAGAVGGSGGTNEWNTEGSTVILQDNTGLSLVAQLIKNRPAVRETRVPSLGWEDPLDKETATRSSVLAWKILWTEEPGGLQSMGSQELDRKSVKD